MQIEVTSGGATIKALKHRHAALLLALAAPMTDARASEPVPVYVTVVGEGNIRVLLSAGVVRPCDALSNKPIFDGWMSAGKTYVFSSPEIFVCERHTHGIMRAGDWLPDRRWSLRAPRVPGERSQWRIDIFLGTR